MEETEGNSEENTNSTVVNSNINSLGESMDDSPASSSKQHAEMLVKLRREKRTRKTKVTKLKHYLQGRRNDKRARGAGRFQRAPLPINCCLFRRSLH